MGYNQAMLRPAEPARELKAFVRKYVQLEAGTPQLIWPIPARSIGCIEFTFGVPYSIRHLDRMRLEITHPATLVGAKTHQRIQLESQGHTETLHHFVSAYRTSDDVWFAR